MVTCGIVNKGFIGIRGFVSRFNYGNGGYERSPQPLLALPRERCMQVYEMSCPVISRHFLKSKKETTYERL